MTPSPPRVCVAGVWVDDVGLQCALKKVEAYVSGGGARQIITANPLMILAAENDRDLRSAFQSAALVVPDSVGVQWAARLRGRRVEKISGIDLLDRLCGEAAVKGWRVFFLGAAPGVAETAARSLAERHPGLTVAGVHHGYFISNEDEAVRAVAATKPDLLFVGLSTPFQDGWIYKNLDRLNAKVVMGVGGSFDVLSGRLRRAPAWVRSAGLEWFFRLLQEPRRVVRMVRLPVFAFKVLLSCLSQ